MTIRSHPTPNPDSLKFEVEGVTFTEEAQLAFFTPGEAKGHDLGETLFALDGVESLLITPEFVTITKQTAAGWTPLADRVEGVLRDHVGG